MRLRELYNSSTIMTLFSLSSKSMSFIIITPFLLSSFSAEEIALWYLLGVFINMQALADFGFYNTFVRSIALAFSGGCSSIRDLNEITNKNRLIGEPNFNLVGKIIGTMKVTYKLLSVLLLIILLVFSVFLKKNIYLLPHPIEGWLSWGTVVFFSLINFGGRPYSNYLLSLNKVALVRKWEGIFNIIAILANIVVVLTTHSLFLLVLTNQFWIIANVLVNKYLSEHSVNYRFSSFAKYKYDKQVFKVVWPLAWRAGLSTVTSQGIVSVSGLLYAQFCDAASASSYLFAEKMYNAIRSYAMAPLYSKIPLLVTLRGKNDIHNWVLISQKGMFLSSMMMVIGIIGFDIFGASIFKLIKSNIVFPTHSLWILLGWAYFFHRYGAMHTQLYTTVNKVNSHISDAITGLIMLCVWLLFINQMGVYVFPIGMLCGYLLFYIWFAGYYSYSIMDLKPIQFEKKANMIPFCILLCYSVVMLLRFI